MVSWATYVLRLVIGFFNFFQEIVLAPVETGFASIVIVFALV